MAKGYKGLCEILLELGRLTGRIHRAEELIETSNKRIDAIKRGLRAYIWKEHMAEVCR